MYVEEQDVDNAVLYSRYLWQFINHTTDQLIARYHPDYVERAENVWWIKHSVVCFNFGLFIKAHADLHLAVRAF